MGIGSKIKELRIKNNYTQKDLADNLHVTYQAVSRWENDEVEPSIDTIKQMAVLFNCSIDELFSVAKQEEVVEESVTKEDIIELNNKIEETKASIEQVQPVLETCHICNKPIYESSHIHRVDFTRVHRVGPTHKRIHETKIYCEECYQNKLKKDNENARLARLAEMDDMKKRRIHSLIWPTIAMVLLLIIAFSDFIKEVDGTNTYIYLAISAFTFFSCLILNNNCVGEVFMNVASWSVRFPGVIFSLDLDGILNLILIKLLFWLLGVLISILAFIAAILIAGFISLFVYPFALIKNLRNKE